MMSQGAVVVISVAALTLASAARAQQADESNAFEVTPFVSLGSNASSGVGAAVRWPLGSRISFEVDTGLRRAEMNALVVNAGLLYDLPRLGRVTPYVAGGIGLGQYRWATNVAGHGPLAQSGTAFTVNAGGGARLPIDETWGFRSDARWSNGIGRNAPEQWRVYNGVTFGATH